MSNLNLAVQENLFMQTGISVTFDGVPAQVYHCDVANFVTVTTTKRAVSLTIQTDFAPMGTIRPLSKNYAYNVVDGKLNLELQLLDKITVEQEGKLPLFIRICRKIEKPENTTLHFKSGEVYDAGTIKLKSNDVVYVEEGAVVCGVFDGDKADNVTITGNGIMYGKPLHYDQGEQVWTKLRLAMMLLVESKNFKLEGVAFIDSPCWNVVPTFCDNVLIDDIMIISVLMCGDGIDIVGCKNVLVQNCFLYTNDDCVALKSVRYFDERGANIIKNVLVKACVMWNNKCGNAIEIGYETSAKEICDITFDDIDVIHCDYEGWQSGGVFTIHNGDRAVVHDVTYSNIRIEQAKEKLIDFKILSSKYSSDLHRGTVSNVTFENIAIIDGDFPPSILRGMESDSAQVNWVENITIKNLTYLGKPITNQLDARMIAELCQNITFQS